MRAMTSWASECAAPQAIEPSVKTTIAPVTERQLAKRTVARVIVDCRRRREIAAMALAASGQAEHGIAYRPCPESIGPGDNVENPIERQLVARLASEVMRVGREQGVSGVWPAIAMITVDGIGHRGVDHGEQRCVLDEAFR